MQNKDSNPYEPHNSSDSRNPAFSLNSLPVELRPTRFGLIFNALFAILWALLMIGCCILFVRLIGIPGSYGPFVCILMATNVLGSLWLVQQHVGMLRSRTTITSQHLIIRRLVSKNISWLDINDWSQKSDWLIKLTLNNGKSYSVLLASRDQARFVANALEHFAISNSSQMRS